MTERLLSSHDGNSVDLQTVSALSPTGEVEVQRNGAISYRGPDGFAKQPSTEVGNLVEAVEAPKIKAEKPLRFLLTALSAHDDIAVQCQKKLIFSRPD